MRARFRSPPITVVPEVCFSVLKLVVSARPYRSARPLRFHLSSIVCLKCTSPQMHFREVRTRSETVEMRQERPLGSLQKQDIRGGG
jgi:hypothetical protein